MKLRALVLLPISFVIAGAAHAGKVEVAFVNPASYSDAGAGAVEEAANLREIDRYLRALGERFLPAAQTLKVEVLEVDLAGTVRPQFDGSGLRLVTGGADFPLIRLRYSLTGDGQPRSGDERVADLDYTRGLANRGDSQALFYEKRMLFAWFKSRFVNGVDH